MIVEYEQGKKNSKNFIKTWYSHDERAIIF